MLWASANNNEIIFFFSVEEKTYDRMFSVIQSNKIHTELRIRIYLTRHFNSFSAARSTKKNHRVSYEALCMLNTCCQTIQQTHSNSWNEFL